MSRMPSSWLLDSFQKRKHEMFMINPTDFWQHFLKIFFKFISPSLKFLLRASKKRPKDL